VRSEKFILASRSFSPPLRAVSLTPSGKSRDRKAGKDTGIRGDHSDFCGSVRQIDARFSLELLLDEANLGWGPGYFLCSAVLIVLESGHGRTTEFFSRSAIPL
jgi:hypothetical protein